MATGFPTSLDAFTNPGPTSYQDDPSVYHDVQHTNLNDALAAVQAYVGVTGSAVTSTLTNRLDSVRSWLAFGTIAANLIFAGPASAGPSNPTWRALVKSDLPAVTSFTDQAATYTALQTFRDNTIRITDDGDTTKIVQFQIAGLATATTRTWSFPDRSDTFAGLAAQTFLGLQTFDLGTGNGTLHAASRTAVLRLSSADLQLAGIEQTCYGATPEISQRFAGGTRAAPSTPVTGNGTILGYAYYWDGTTFYQAGRIRNRVSTTHTGTEAANDWRFGCVRAGDTTRTLVESTVIDALGLSIGIADGRLSILNTTTTGTDPLMLSLVTSSGGGFSIRPDDLSLANPVWKIFSNANESIAIWNGASETARFVGPQYVMGYTSTLTFSSSINAKAQFVGTSISTASVGVARYSANNGQSNLTLAKSRSATPGTPGVVVPADFLGSVTFDGDDGTNFVGSSRILTSCEGTIATGIVPGVMDLQTASSAGTLQTAVRINSSQQVAIGTTSYVSSERLRIAGGTIATPGATDVTIGGGSLSAGAAISAKNFVCAVGTITSALSALSSTATWNAGAVTFNGWLLNVVNTASAAASTLIDLQVSAASKFKVDVAGLITTASATLHATSVALTNGAAANAGTLTNAPVAGNPTKWVPINDNGTTRYIPAW